MKLYKQILLTHDGSELSTQAIQHAVEIAKAFNASILVLQVVDSVAKIISAVNISALAFEAQEIYESIAQTEKDNAKKNLTKIRTLLEREGITKVTTSMREGDARDTIVETAKEKACDIIIMSTHGRSGIRRALLGSVAEDVLRHAPCPVLLVREKKTN